MLYRFEEIEKSYGPHDVLRGVTWQHNPGEKVGLVGRNGAGKTTLFRLLLKQEEADRGQIIRASDLTIGHIGQHLDAEPGMSLFDYVETAFAEVLAIERKMRAMEHDLADPEKDHHRLLDCSMTTNISTAIRCMRKWSACSPAWGSRNRSGSDRSPNSAAASRTGPCSPASC